MKLKIPLEKKTVILLGFGISGMAALIYEVVWTRLLILIFGSTVYALSTLLTAFLGGLALGSFFVGRNLHRIKDYYFAFAIVEICIGIYGILFPFLLSNLQYTYFFLYETFQHSFVMFQISQVLLYLAILIFPTFLMGATFPLASKLLISKLDNVGKDVSYIYATNTFGSVLGPIFSGFILIPLIGLRETSLVAAILNFAVGAIIFQFSGYGKKNVLLVPVVAAGIFLANIFFSYPMNFVNFYYINQFKNINDIDNYLKSTSILFNEEGLYSTVQVTSTPPDITSLRIDGHIDASNNPLDMTNQLLLAYFPMLLHPNSTSILNIGLGGGFTAGALKNFDANVDVVEIDRGVIDAEKYFSQYNNNALDNPKLKLIQNDARNFLLLNKDKYDVIISEPSHPITSSVNHLFTKEFFNSVKEHLQDNGLFAQWIPTHRIDENEYKILVNTLESEFPYVSVWNSSTISGGGDTILIASKNSYNLNFSSVTNPKVISDLQNIGINSVNDLNSLLLLNFSDSKDFVKDTYILNTDDFPVVEFLIPQSFFR